MSRTPLDRADAQRFLDAVVARDFVAMAETLSDDLEFRAVTPSAMRDERGADALVDAMRGWFAGLPHMEPVETDIGQIGDRLHLRWRLRVQFADQPGLWHVVEQQAYADGNGGIDRLHLLCSGFRRE